MRALALVPVALALSLLGACASEPLASPPDGGGAADLAPTQSCGDVSAAVAEWIGNHQSCTQDSDCVEVNTSCGLVGACSTYANTAAPGEFLDGLVAEWTAMRCAEPCGCPAHPPARPGCTHGVCGPKPYGTRPLGAPCTDGSDCATGECVTAAEIAGFTNGYCTVRGCLAKGGVCPMGGICRDVGVNNAGLCLAPCTLSTGNDCRTGDGYACCNGPGASNLPGACVPTSSVLCQP